MEHRPLIHPTKHNHHAQGQLQMWLEVLPVEVAALHSPLDLSQPEIYAGELRVVIWGATQLRSMDPEGLNDAYVRVWLAEDEHSAHCTDTHWRSMHGRANWNYRMKFKVIR